MTLQLTRVCLISNTHQVFWVIKKMGWDHFQHKRKHCNDDHFISKTIAVVSLDAVPFTLQRLSTKAGILNQFLDQGFPPEGWSEFR